VALFLSSQLHAQAALENQIDFNTARADAALGTSLAPASLPTIGSIVSFGAFPSSLSETIGISQSALTKPLTLNVLSPLDYDDVNGSRTGEATPEIKFSFLIHPSQVPLQFSGFLDESSDRYTGSAPGNDRLDGSLRLDWVGIKSFPDRDRFIPYFSYTPQVLYDPFFDGRKSTIQDYALGFNKLCDFNPDWSKPDTSAPYLPTWEIGLQFAVQHRITDSGPDSNAVVASPSLKWAATNAAHFPGISPDMLGQLAASAGLSVTHRWYDTYQDVAQRLWTLSPILSISWVLPAHWFGQSAAKIGAPEIDFQFAYTNTDSNLELKSSHQWALGPSVKFGWNF
jgi:hypothetical protein